MADKNGYTVLKVQTGASTYAELPTPSTLNVTDELVWGSNTGRTSTGKMVGDFKGFKQKIEVSWNLLTASQMQQLRSALHTAQNRSPFFNIQYWDIEAGASGGLVTKKVYMNEIPRQLYSVRTGYRFYQEVEIHFIEQ